MKIRALLVVILVLLAGCGGSLEETETTTIESTQTPTTQTGTPSVTTPAETTKTRTTQATTVAPRPANPWNKENVTVSVRYKVNESRNITPLVNETLDYWNNESDEYGAYSEITFVSTPNDRFSDIVIEVVPGIDSCGFADTDNTVGCAPILDEYDSPTVPERVQIVAGYSNDSTTQILKHEFGHVLGIEHGEDPLPLMEPMHRHTYLSQPDATDRKLPWRNSTLSVHIDMENQTYRQTAREQVQHALNYYERGAEGHAPENISFIITENESTADIVVSSPTAVTCGEGRSPTGSCGWIRGYNTDTDDELEYYSRVEIRVGHQTNVDSIGWHVGSWLADAFGLESKDELPPPFVDADYETAHGEWWEE